MLNAPLLTTAKGRQALQAIYEDGLLCDTVPFWFPRSVDAEYGGFFSCFDRDGTLVDTDKSVWAQGRICWMLLSLYRTLDPRPEWLNWAERGLQFLEKCGFDTDGRMYFHLTREGRPIRRRRYAFSESFAAIAWAAYARIAGKEKAALRALELFRSFADWNFTPGRMPPKYTMERPLIGLAPRMITLVTAQELRADLGENTELTAWIDRCVEEIRQLFVKPDLRVVMESVGERGEILDHFDGRILNPGHAIEGAWFIMREGKHRSDSSLIRLGCDMLDWMWERGWDEEYGGIFYFRDVYDRPVQEYWHDMKFWWPHNEAVIATLLAYELTGDLKYAIWHQQVHDWAFDHFPDPAYGEWYGYLHRDGRVSVTLKGNLWKSFFHLPRMQWICRQALADSRCAMGAPPSHR